MKKTMTIDGSSRSKNLINQLLKWKYTDQLVVDCKERDFFDHSYARKLLSEFMVMKIDFSLMSFGYRTMPYDRPWTVSNCKDLAASGVRTVMLKVNQNDWMNKDRILSIQETIKRLQSFEVEVEIAIFISKDFQHCIFDLIDQFYDRDHSVIYLYTADDYELPPLGFALLEQKLSKFLKTRNHLEIVNRCKCYGNSHMFKMA